MAHKKKNAAPVVPKKIIGALADAFGNSTLTIQRWIIAHDDRLTSDRAKAVYAQENFDWKILEPETVNHG